MNIFIGKDEYGFYIRSISKNSDMLDMLMLSDTPIWEDLYILYRRKDHFRSSTFQTREDAEKQLKRWFNTQPPEVFAKYVAERLKSHDD